MTDQSTKLGYFLAKTEPDHDYSIDDLENEGITLWDNVHNNAAILHIQKMRPGDHVYIYHSGKDKAIVGLAEVIDEPYLNLDDPRRSYVVHLKFVKKYETPLTLAQIKAEPLCKDFLLVRIGRLSVMPVPPEINAWLESKLS